MKILLFIDNLGSGGAQRQITALACLLKKNGYEVKILIYQRLEFYMQDIIDYGIQIDKIYCKNKVKRLLQIVKYIRKGWQNVVISFLETPNFLANISSVGYCSWKVITSERNGTERSFFGLKNRVYKWFERYSDTIVCNSYNAKNIWIKFYPKYERKLKVISNCVGLPDHVANDKYVIRAGGKTNIIILASYQESKNIDGLIEALRLLTDHERNKIKIEWYGEKNVYNYGTTVYDKAIDKIEKYGFSSILYLNGVTKNVIEKIENADALALFSKYEGFPNVICEAMVLSKPVIMTRVSDYNTLIDEENGILCDSDNLQSIANALSKIINANDKEIFAMGRASKQKANILFNKETYFLKWDSIIKTI